MRLARTVLAAVLAIRGIVLAFPGIALALVAFPAAPQERATPGAFDFYVLALSWSPEYCAGPGRERASPQCDPARRLGFVTHGLWPQYERGYPSACDSRGAPPAAIAETGDLYPDPGLARHEWRMHGTCSGLPAAAYFRAVRQARDKVAIPEPLSDLARDGQTTAANIERAFAASNPGLRPEMMSVTCRRGALQEVRICLDRDLRGFRACPEIDRQACRFGPIRVTAPR